MTSGILTPTCERCGGLRSEYQRLNRRRLGMSYHRRCCCVACDPESQVEVTFENIVPCSGCVLLQGESNRWRIDWDAAPSLNGTYVASFLSTSGTGSDVVCTYRYTAPAGEYLRYVNFLGLGSTCTEFEATLRLTFDVRHELATNLFSLRSPFLKPLVTSNHRWTAWFNFQGGGVLPGTWVDSSPTVCGGETGLITTWWMATGGRVKMEPASA